MLLNQCQKQWIDIRAICDINPAHSKGAADGLETKGLRRPTEYQDLKQMLEKEDLEAILIATPLWSHADLTVQCLDAGKHVLCEKMMAWDVPSCHRMADAAAKQQAAAGDRLPALLQPHLPRGLRGHPQEGPAGRRVPHPHRLAPERHPGAARKRRPARTSIPSSGATRTGITW